MDDNQDQAIAKEAEDEHEVVDGAQLNYSEVSNYTGFNV